MEYYEHRKYNSVVSYKNNTFLPAKVKANELVKKFGFPLAMENKIEAILLNNPNLASELEKNIKLFIGKMSEYGYSIEESKKVLASQGYITILEQSNLGLTRRLELLERNNLEEKALTLFPNLIYGSTRINEKALPVISECLKAHGLTSDEVDRYYAMHTDMLKQNSVELRRTFALLHRRNLLASALFDDNKLLSTKADSSLMYAMIESADEAGMNVTIGNLYDYSKSLNREEKDALKSSYEFTIKQKIYVDYFYNDFVKSSRENKVRERK